MAQLISVNVGLPRDIDWQGKKIRTAVWKAAVPGRAMVRRLNIDGDEQGDLAGHGGEHRAVMVYQIDSYRYWERHLTRKGFEYGQFGENLTVEGLSDDEVCIGDRYRIGSALFEVTQPRVTCYRVGIRMNNPQMPALLVSHKRPGFYFRVIEEGEVGAGDEIIKVADGPERITVSEVDGLLYLPGHREDRLARALCVPALSPGWRASLEALRSAAGQQGNAGLAPSSEPAPAWPGFRALRVTAIHQECTDVRSFVFEAADDAPLPHPLPGQFLVFKIAAIENADPIFRSYSISGGTRASTYRVSVKRGDGDGSRYLHDRVRVGDQLHVSAPRGSFTLVQSNQPIVFLSAGIGATPLLSMLQSLTDSSADEMREVWWCYGTTNLTAHPFIDEVRDALSRLSSGHSFVAYSKPTGIDVLGRDFDVAGHLSVESLEALSLPKDANFYLCGPPSFLSDLTTALREWGVDSGSIHSEIFGAESSLTPGIATSPAIAPHAPFDHVGASGPNVSFTRSGLTVRWDQRFGSLLEFAEACDVPVRWSCRSGVCHNCESGIIEGCVAYSPEPLEKPAEGKILLCCSVPRSVVHLDL